MNVKTLSSHARSLLPLTVVALAALSLGACSLFHRHSAKDSYQNAGQARPLEVPPDLDSPASATALTIPDASGPSVGQRREDGTLVLGAPSATVSAPGTPPAMPGVRDAGDNVKVADTPDSTWRRVGLALERSGTATIVARDGSAHSYEIEARGQVRSKPGWFKRAITLGHAGDSTTTSAPVRLNVRISGSGDASTVSVEGPAGEAGDSAARTVRAVLKERLS